MTSAQDARVSEELLDDLLARLDRDAGNVRMNNGSWSDTAFSAAAAIRHLRRATPKSETDGLEQIIDAVQGVDRYAPKTIPMGANPPLFDGMQRDHDGPWVSRVEVAKKLRAMLSAAPAQREARPVTDAMVKAAEAAVYSRHERGFLMKPLIDPIDMRAALEAAIAAQPEKQ